MALRTEVVDLIGLEVPDEVDQRAGVRQIAVVHEEPHPGLMGISIDVVQTLGVEGRGSPDETVHLIALGQEQLGQVRTVLSSDAGDERLLHRHSSLLRSPLSSRTNIRSICASVFDDHRNSPP